MLLRDFVNKKMASADKEASAEGYPLTLNDCKKYKKMKQLEIYGNSFQDGAPTPDNPIEVQSVGELVSDVNDTNYGKYKIPLVQRGINLFDVKTYPLTTGHWINGNTGLYLNDKMYAATQDFIPCADLIGKTITISRTGGGNPGIAFYDDNKTYVSGKGNGNSAYTKLTTTVPENAVYYRFCVVADYKDTAQIQEGSTVLPYEPYVEPTTTNIFLDEPLRKIGDYADYIDFKNNKVVRNIGALNSEQINKQNIMKYASDAYGYNNSYRFAAFGLLNTSARNLKLAYCNLLGDGTFFTNAPLTSISYSSGGFLYLRFDDENNYGVTNIATCKQWIKDNNLLIHCVRNTPTEEPIICNLPKLNAKTSIIEVGTSLAASNAKGKYIKR